MKKDTKEKYILDACALIAYIDFEDGATVIEDLIDRASIGEIHVYINCVNFLEVYYHTLGLYGKQKAKQLVSYIKDSDINVIFENNMDILIEAGRIKSCNKLSLADSIGLATSIVYKGCFVTADYHELETVKKKESLNIIWFRPKKVKKH